MNPRHDLSIIVTTVGRASLLRAVRSIFSQRFSGPLQVLIGVDTDLSDGKLADYRATIEAECPAHISLLWLDPGYSTSRRHGGVHDCCFGGSLRAILTLLADARFAMYLDDDDWLLEDHVTSLLSAIDGKSWAFAYSWFCDGQTGERLCVDEIESVGIGRGVFTDRFGGFVRPSGMAIDSLALLKYLYLWSCSPFPAGDGVDRLIFDRLSRHPVGCTERATVCYSLDPNDDAAPLRRSFIEGKGKVYPDTPKPDSLRRTPPRYPAGQPVPRHDLSIIVTTVGRTSLLRTVRSIFSQRFSGPLQVLIGVDTDLSDGKLADHRATIEAECPAHISLLWLDPGYSTSRRHGGVHDCCFGGSMRSALTLLADARFVTYLDDDDWLLPEHAATILSAIEGKSWAYSFSWYADGDTSEPLCIDEIESVGVDQGIYAETYGGFVRPSGLTIDKLALLKYVHLWSTAGTPSGDGEDRVIFSRLRHEPHACTGQATVCCAIDPHDPAHPARVEFMHRKGITFRSQTKSESTRGRLTAEIRNPKL
ncbi:MAG: glycosyltransferase family 2 protein [Verrucomicrobiales bacterium]|nr:glycosyltransferase family 2 protein [Verrucomicrobiales bacterium]